MCTKIFVRTVLMCIMHRVNTALRYWDCCHYLHVLLLQSVKCFVLLNESITSDLAGTLAVYVETHWKQDTFENSRRICQNIYKTPLVWTYFCISVHKSTYQWPSLLYVYHYSIEHSSTLPTLQSLQWNKTWHRHVKHLWLTGITCNLIIKTL